MSVKLFAWAWQQAVPNSTTKLVLLKLADQADDHGVCWPSQDSIAKNCNVTDRTIRRHLAALKEAGLIEIVPRYRDNGSQASSEYRLAVDTGDHGGRTQVASLEPSVEPLEEEKDSSSGPGPPVRPVVVAYLEEFRRHRGKRPSQKDLVRIGSMAKVERKKGHSTPQLARVAQDLVRKDYGPLAFPTFVENAARDMPNGILCSWPSADYMMLTLDQISECDCSRCLDAVAWKGGNP